MLTNHNPSPSFHTEVTQPTVPINYLYAVVAHIHTTGDNRSILCSFIN